MSRVPLYQVDAFAEAPFRGNPAAVCLLGAGGLDDATMQAVAIEMNLSETAFVTPPAADEPTAAHGLRWFTPAAEVDLCGHATLAAASVLFTQHTDRTVVDFDTRSGRLTVERNGAGRLTMNLPASPRTPASAPRGLLAALGVGGNVTACRTRSDILIELPDADAVRRLTPDMRALRQVDTRGVIVTARADDGDDVDFVSRFFAPGVGVDEDPVTGSAHCALAPWWCERLGRSAVRGRQISHRPGVVACQWTGGPTVALSGDTVLVFAGELILPD